MAARRILITGATGKQGGATLKALAASASANAPFTYTAVTRDPSSASAQRLTSIKNVSVVKGGLEDPAAVFKQITEPVWGYFLVTMPGKNEEKSGKLAIDAAIKANVRHLVFASVERRDNTQPTYVPHFASKHNIELYLMKRAKETGMTWTILRPVAFMDNFTNNFFGKAFATWWRQLGNKSLQIVAVEDIGFWGAKAFNEASGWGRNNELSIAGDDLTYAQAAAAFRQKTGREMPSTYNFVGSAIKSLSHEMKTMFAWFAELGWDVNAEALRKENPGLKTWGQWLETSSQFKDEIAAHKASN